MHRFAVWMIAVVMSGSVSAQAGYIECTDSGERAVTQMPSPANKLARVSCTRWGHIIQPVVDWIWTQPGAFRQVFFPAQMVVANPAPNGNKDHFIDIRVRELSADESIEKWQFIAAFMPGPVPSDLRSLEIFAENKMGQHNSIYLFNSGWGYGCSPKCAKETIFLLLNKNKQNVSW